MAVHILITKLGQLHRDALEANRRLLSWSADKTPMKVEVSARIFDKLILENQRARNRFTALLYKVDKLIPRTAPSRKKKGN